MKTSQRFRAFALVITLLLLVILASTGAGLAMIVAAESLDASGRWLDLQHELALDSLLVLTAGPDVLIADPERDEHEPLRLDVVVGSARLVAEAHDSSGKRLMRDGEPSETSVELRELATAAELWPQNVRVVPLHETERDLLGTYLWYDQLVEPTQFEELFRWRFRPAKSAATKEQKCWSDLVTFWSPNSGKLVTWEAETWIGGDVRRWFLVVEVKGGRVQVLHRSRI